MNTTIREHGGDRDQEIVDLALSIQNGEVRLNVNVQDQPAFRDITTAQRDGSFWTTVDGRKGIVVTIDLLTYGHLGLLTKLVVAASLRGRGARALGLLDHLLIRARDFRMTDIVVGTPAVATRSHVLCATNGFEPATVDKLLAGYGYAGRDSILVRLQLMTSS